MAFTIEVLTGAAAKQALPESGPLVVGRTEKAQFQVPGDATLSGVHFELKADGGKLLLSDSGSRSGTFLNGGRVNEPVEVKVGDRIQAGQSVFLIGEMPSFGSWILDASPGEWEELPGKGYKERVEEGPFSSLLFTEEPQDSDKSLPEYVADQQMILRELRPEWQMRDPRPLQYAGAEEALVLDIRVPPEAGKPGEIRQLYVRTGKRFGTATLTAEDNKLEAARKAMEQAMRGARFAPAVAEPALA